MKLSDSYARLKARRPDLTATETELALSEAIADLIVSARVRGRLTQAALAKAAGTTQARISAVERGEANPTLDTLARLVTALRQHIDMSAFLSLMGSARVTSDGRFAPAATLTSRIKTNVTEVGVTTGSSGLTAGAGEFIDATDVELDLDSELAFAA